MTGTEHSWLQRLWQRLKDRLVQEVPDEVGACEYGCRKPDCRNGDWDSCQRRISYHP